LSILHFYFGWPDGAVYSNLIASVVCVGLAWWRLRVQSIAHHLERMTQADRHHREMKAHVTATVTAAVRQQKRLVPKTPARPGGDLE
jgi:hypothetical protein